MKHSHVKWTGLAERITIQEAAGHVVKETGKSLDHTTAFLVDCAEQGYFSPDVVAHSDYANVSHISRVDPSRSTVSTAELVEWLDHEIEEAHQDARESLASEESRKWGYPVKPDDLRVHLIPWSEQFDDLAQDDTVSMTTRNWVEYLTQEVAERQAWTGAEREAKCAVVRAEYLNLFVALASTLPLVQELTRSPWQGAKLLPDWLTKLHLVKAELREWAETHAPEIAKSRLLADPKSTVSKSSPLSAPPVATTTAQVIDNAPPALPTPVIAAAFDGIGGWNHAEWVKNLGNTPKWALPARVGPGRRGRGGAAMWNPVHLAQLMIEQGSVNKNLLRGVFRKKPDLAPWLAAWEEYERNDVWFNGEKPAI